MSTKSSTETVVAIVQAFLERRRWSQADLARHAGVGVPALRKRLDELSASGFPLRSEADHPHVYWRMPADWFPGGVMFGSEDIPELLRQLSRLPRSKARDQFIRRIIDAAPRGAPRRPEPSPVVAPEITESEQTYLPVVEDAANRGATLHFKYFTASRGAVEWRYASVQRVVIGPPGRFLAVCHRDASLKWFRLDNVLGGHLDASVSYRVASAERVAAFLRESVDGFHQGGAVACAFFVREPESHWVEQNLPGAFARETVPGGKRFTTTTAGVLRLARFVVGLGAAGRAETKELATLVEELARGALDGRRT